MQKYKIVAVNLFVFILYALFNKEREENKPRSSVMSLSFS